MVGLWSHGGTLAPLRHGGTPVPLPWWNPPMCHGGTLPPHAMVSCSDPCPGGTPTLCHAMVGPQPRFVPWWDPNPVPCHGGTLPPHAMAPRLYRSPCCCHQELLLGPKSQRLLGTWGGERWSSLQNLPSSAFTFQKEKGEQDPWVPGGPAPTAGPGTAPDLSKTCPAHWTTDTG